MPVLCGDKIVGRIEPAFEREEARLRIVRAWWEQGADISHAALPFARGISRLGRFLGARSIVMEDVGPPKFKSAVKREVHPSEE